MNYFTKEMYKEKINNIIIEMRPEERDIFVAAFNEVMEVEMDSKFVCPNCNGKFDYDTDTSYCKDCYSALEDEVNTTDDIVVELKKENELLSEENIELNKKIEKLSFKEE